MYFNEAEFRQCSEFLTIVEMYDSHISDNKILNELLPEKVELASFYSGYNDLFKKAFTVACGNSFEKKLTKEIPILLSKENLLGFNFLANQALDRKFHTLFKWETNNANKFFSLFGSEFKTYIGEKLRENKEYKQYEKDFLELGNLRNIIVHEGIYNYSLGRDIESIYVLFKNSMDFIVFVCRSLCSYYNEKCMNI